MTLLQIIKKDIIHYHRSLSATLLLAMVCSMILIGALLVGDSVRYTLRDIARMRLGEKTKWAMTPGDRFFRQELAGELERKTDSLLTTPVLALQGVLETPDGSVRVNGVNIYGIENEFVQLSPEPGVLIALKVFEFSVSESVAARIDIPGDYLLRIQSSSELSNDLIFATEGQDSQAWSIQIGGILPDDAMGRFGLQASQAPPLNVFVPIDWLAEKAEVPDKANLLLAGIDGKKHSTESELSAALKDVLKTQDFELEFRKIAEPNTIELRTSRIFLDEPIAEAALQSGQGAYGIFTYFVNEIRSGNKTVPYSTVSALGSTTEQGLFAALDDNEIIINEWLADELAADPGDSIELTFFQLTDTRTLIEKTVEFTVKQVAPMMGTFADPTLMPDYPGLTEAESCRDWEAGIPIDFDKVGSEDEDYWDRYKGAPKAFISMAAAQRIWSNRFGTLTAVRWPASQNTLSDIQVELKEKLDPAQVGFVFRDVQAAAKKSAAGSSDFSGLFAGLSMFLIFSAAILLALGFAFYIESRSEHIGLLRAVGWNWLRIFALFLAEGSVLAIIGCLAGMVVSVLYTQVVITLLNATFLSRALASLQIGLGVSPWTMFKGVFISFLICVVSMQAALFGRLRRPVHRLLTGTWEESYQPRKRKISITEAIGWILLIGGIVISLESEIDQSQVALFFLSGILSLTGILMILTHWLKWLRHRSGSFARSLKWMAVKNLPRRLSRTLAVLITLSCGVFLVVSVGANYKQLDPDVTDRKSGTGGFALLGSTTLPITETISLPADTENQIPAIEEEDVLPMRIYQQDDASCLNLNRAQNPTLLGVNVNEIASKNPFTFQSHRSDEQVVSPWSLLEQQPEDGSIPVVGDYSTVYWSLGKKLNETISYRAENGSTIDLKIVGILKESVLQGRLLMSETQFVRHFPSVDGYGVFLIDTDAQNLDAKAKLLSRRYRDAGMEVVSTADRLAQFNEVENAYLMIFLVLGGLGLVLGSLGLGFVLTLNVLDRRPELALMQAVGFRPNLLRKMLYIEHSILLVAGIVCGLIPAVWAVWPSILIQGKAFPFGLIVVTILGMLICGLLWIQLAGRMAMKKNFLDILRNQ